MALVVPTFTLITAAIRLQLTHFIVAEWHQAQVAWTYLKLQVAGAGHPVVEAQY